MLKLDVFDFTQLLVNSRPLVETKTPASGD
jgi:hypothetical protein